MLVLFLNHKVQSCGVYQYGLRMYNILKKSNENNYIYCEIENYNEYLHYINFYKPDAIIYNYHLATMNWLNEQNIQHTVKNIAIPHESNSHLFDIILSINPDEVETNNVFNIPRPIYENVDNILSTYKIQNKEISEFINYNEGPEIPIFGSFGFGFLNKGFDKVVDTINNNYKKAIIKLIITLAHFDPNKHSNSHEISNLCYSKNTNPNIKLMITHQFFTNEELLMFLSSNTTNIFLYDKMDGRGISSVIDYAISVKKPFVISDSYMFRHIYSHDICVYKVNIDDAINNSKKILTNLYDKYSHKNVIEKIDKIINIKIKLNNILSAYYYNENYIEAGNVTDLLLNLYYKFQDNDIPFFIASNDIFQDTYFGVYKYLFINIKNNNNEVTTLKYNENQGVCWNVIMDNINKTQSYTVEVSIGEIIDKYSILELKKKYIIDQTKLNDIQKEMNILKPYTEKLIDNYFYKLLLHINELIWLDTDKIKSLSLVNKEYQHIYLFAETSQQIFENNQKRFRLKNYFNTMQNSNVKEQKSYQNDKCFIQITDDTTIYEKIPELNYLFISHDLIYIDLKYKQIVNKLFKNLNIQFLDNIDNIDNINNIIYDLHSFSLELKLKHIYEFEPIRYVSGGLFGDFLNQLSVVAEKFYETGRKGILYISNDGDPFRKGIDIAYNDTFNSISQQIYIKEYKIYNNEPVDIQLSSWRNNFSYNDNWVQIYGKNYDVNWANHKWLSSNIDSNWTNKIVINISPYRSFNASSLKLFLEHITPIMNSCVFVSNENEWFKDFVKKTGLQIEYYQPNTFDETVSIVNSCKMGYLGLSSMAVIANALHKPHILITSDVQCDNNLNLLKGFLPHILDILS